MSKESYVDIQAREFAHHIQCDPELAHELYYKYGVNLTSDSADKMSLDAEIKAWTRSRPSLYVAPITSTRTLPPFAQIK